MKIHYISVILWHTEIRENATDIEAAIHSLHFDNSYQSFLTPSLPHLTITNNKRHDKLTYSKLNYSVDSLNLKYLCNWWSDSYGVFKNQFKKTLTPERNSRAQCHFKKLWTAPDVVFIWQWSLATMRFMKGCKKTDKCSPILDRVLWVRLNQEVAYKQANPLSAAFLIKGLGPVIPLLSAALLMLLLKIHRWFDYLAIFSLW